jgi:hypothetical protein
VEIGACGQRIFKIQSPRKFFGVKLLPELLVSVRDFILKVKARSLKVEV